MMCAVLYTRDNTEVLYLSVVFTARGLGQLEAEEEDAQSPLLANSNL
jgi:hypothetical protein